MLMKNNMLMKKINVKKYNQTVANLYSIEQSLSHRIEEILKLYIHLSSSFYNIANLYNTQNTNIHNVQDLLSAIMIDEKTVKQRISETNITHYVKPLGYISVKIKLLSEYQKTNEYNSNVVFYHIDSNDISQESNETATLFATSFYDYYTNPNNNCIIYQNNNTNTPNNTDNKNNPINRNELVFIQSIPSKLLNMNNKQLLYELFQIFLLNFDYMLYCRFLFITNDNIFKELTYKASQASVQGLNEIKPYSNKIQSYAPIVFPKLSKIILNQLDVISI